MATHSQEVHLLIRSINFVIKVIKPLSKVIIAVTIANFARVESLLRFIFLLPIAVTPFIYS